MERRIGRGSPVTRMGDKVVEVAGRRRAGVAVSFVCWGGASMQNGGKWEINLVSYGLGKRRG
jgi:hypothetical protein